mgnify:CR=1 FL=1
MIVEFSFTSGHIAEDIVHNGNALETILEVYGCLRLQIFVFL